MPRIDRNWIVIERSMLERDTALGLLETARDYRGVFVTSPSLVYVDSGLRTVRVSLGIGSLVLPPESGARGWRVTAPEWVDGCRLESEGRRLQYVGRGGVGLDGVVEALDVKDVVALSINGERGPMVVREGALDTGYPLARIDGRTILWLTREGDYVTAIGEWDRLWLLEYIALGASMCRGR